MIIMNRLLKPFIIIAGLVSLIHLTGYCGYSSLEQSNVLSAAVKQHYGLNGVFELTPLMPLPAIPNAPTSVELVEVPATPASTMMIKARFIKDGSYLGEVSASFRANWRVNALVAKRSVGRGPINISDFEIQNLDRLAQRQNIVSPDEKTEDLEITNTIQAGAPLVWSVVKSKPLVRKGGLADVIAQDGQLKVTTKAIATQDAGRGDSVIMRNPNTNRQFEAYVLNENLVQIRF